MKQTRFLASPVAALSLGVFICNGTARAVPTTLTYAGVLTDDGARVEGTHDVLFELFDDDAGGTVQYSEQLNGLVVLDGELIAELGTNNLDDSVLDLPELWLEITVDGTTLGPRVRLNSVPYALRAEAAFRAAEALLADEALSLGGILPNEVVTDAELLALGLASGLSAGAGINVAGGTISIAAGGVGVVELADGAVTNAKLAAGAVTTSKLAAGAVGTQELAVGAVTGLQLATNAVSTGNLVDASVTGSKLADAAVGTTKLADGAVTAVKIANATITTTQIASNAIALAQLQSNSVDGGKIVNGSVTSLDIGDGSINAVDYGTGSVGSAAIATNGVTTAEIADGTIGASDIRGGAENVFVTAAGCERGGVTLAASCNTAMCGIVGGTPRFFDCSRLFCTQTTSLSCANNAVGFIFRTSFVP